MTFIVADIYGAKVGALGRAMPTCAHHETWEDWKPPEAPEPKVLLDREELLARLNDLHIEASERDLKFWQGQGLIPRGTKKRVGRSTLAYYPRATLALIILLRDLQGLGLPLRDIRPYLKNHAAHAFQIAHDTEGPTSGESDPQPSQRPSTRGDVILRNETRRAAKTAVLGLLNPGLVKLARQYEALTDEHVSLVRVTFYARRDGSELKELDHHDFTVL